jgi:hypothetical protein
MLAISIQAYANSPCARSLIQAVIYCIPSVCPLLASPAKCNAIVVLCMLACMLSDLSVAPSFVLSVCSRLSLLSVLADCHYIPTQIMFTSPGPESTADGLIMHSAVYSVVAESTLTVVVYLTSCN